MLAMKEYGERQGEYEEIKRDAIVFLLEEYRFTSEETSTMLAVYDALVSIYNTNAISKSMDLFWEKELFFDYMVFEVKLEESLASWALELFECACEYYALSQQCGSSARIVSAIDVENTTLIVKSKLEKSLK